MHKVSHMGDVMRWDEDEMVWNIIKIKQSEKGGMCWLRNVEKENMILINYHKMSPNDHEVDILKEKDALMTCINTIVNNMKKQEPKWP